MLHKNLFIRISCINIPCAHVMWHDDIGIDKMKKEMVFVFDVV